MLSFLLRASQFFYRLNFRRMGSLFEKMMKMICSADISGRANIHPHVSFSHGGIGVIVNPASEIGEGCIISAKVTIGNAFPHGGAPRLGKHVYVGIGAFIGGKVKIADYVIIGANSVVTKDIDEPYCIYAGIPARKLRGLSEEEIEMLNW